MSIPDPDSLRPRVVTLGTAGGPRWWRGEQASRRTGIATAVVVGEAVYLVPRGDGRSYWLEFRRPQGVFDDFAAAGFVFIAQSELLRNLADDFNVGGGFNQMLAETLGIARTPDVPLPADLLDLAPGLAVRSTSWSLGNLGADALLPLLRARSVDEVDRAFDHWVEPVNNLVVADRAGHLRYRIIGRVPVRADDGTWTGWLDDPAMLGKKGDTLLTAGGPHPHRQGLGLASGVDHAVPPTPGDSHDPGAEANPIVEGVGQWLQIPLRPLRPGRRAGPRRVRPRRHGDADNGVHPGPDRT